MIDNEIKTIIQATVDQTIKTANEKKLYDTDDLKNLTLSVNTLQVDVKELKSKHIENSQLLTATLNGLHEFQGRAYKLIGEIQQNCSARYELIKQNTKKTDIIEDHLKASIVSGVTAIIVIFGSVLGAVYWITSNHLIK